MNGRSFCCTPASDMLQMQHFSHYECSQHNN
jgi:hypothetical protein